MIMKNETRNKIDTLNTIHSRLWTLDVENEEQATLLKIFWGICTECCDALSAIIDYPWISASIHTGIAHDNASLIKNDVLQKKKKEKYIRKETSKIKDNHHTNIPNKLKRKLDWLEWQNQALTEQVRLEFAKHKEDLLIILSEEYTRYQDVA